MDKMYNICAKFMPNVEYKINVYVKKKFTDNIQNQKIFSSFKDNSFNF